MGKRAYEMAADPDAYADSHENARCLCDVSARSMK